MKHLVIASLMVVAASAQPALAQADRAAAVLAEARKALGGEDKLRAVKTLEASGAFRRTFGEAQMDGDLEILIETPDKFRRNEDINMPGGAMMTRTEVLNGQEVWDDSGQRGGMGHSMVMMRGPGGDADPERMKEMQRRMRRIDLARFSLAWLLASDATVAHAGVAEAPDGKADVLEFTPADGGPALRLFVDQKTHRPLMVTWRGPEQRMMIRRGGPDADRAASEAAANAPAPREVTFEMRLDDYRAVDGIQLPHTITRGVSGQPNEEWTIKSYKINPSFKPNTFTK